MTEMLFDTQKAVDRLVEAGVPPAHAHAYAAVLVDVIGSLDAHHSGRYAGKDLVADAIRDLDTRMVRFEADVRSEFAAVRAEMQGIRSDLMRWVLTVVVAAGFIQSALIVGLLLKLLP
jgi:hypothetical protein